MNSHETLLVKAGEYLPPQRMRAVEAAYRFGEKAHDGQTRRSGGPFLEHPLQTALYLAELKLDADALAAALLHAVMEDCDVSYEELSDEFGDEIARLVDGVTKLTKAELMTAEAHVASSAAFQDADTLCKMLMSMA